jgi:hypothetical protein
VLLTLSFFLPFVLVSCDTAATAPISGMDLARQVPPTFTERGDRSAHADVLDAVQRMQIPAAVILGCAVIGAAVGLARTSPRLRDRLWRGQLLAAVGVYLGGWWFFASGLSLMGYATVHHLPGFWVATALGIASVAASAKEIERAPDEPARDAVARIARFLGTASLLSVLPAWIFFSAAVETWSMAFLALIVVGAVAVVALLLHRPLWRGWAALIALTAPGLFLLSYA